MRNSAPPAFRWILLLSAICLVQLTIADSPESQPVWRAGAGSMALEIRGDYLADFGIEILHQGHPIAGRERLQLKVESIEPMAVHAPWGIFDSLVPGNGRLAADLDLVIRRNERTVRIDRLQLVPDDRNGHPLIVALDERGKPLFTLTHIHMSVEPDSGVIRAANAEIEASAQLAESLGFEALAGMPIGTGWLDLDLAGGARSEPTGTPPGCDERPIWPQRGQYRADVTLIDMDNVVYQGTHPDSGDDRIKIAPSAKLKNESLADVPWIGQFDSLGSYPYTPADQHPFLVWNLYRIADGRIEMLAGSGAKHAFYTINVECISCGSNHVLWSQCEDVYAASSNDMSKYQGPRHEIDASVGFWDNCKSFFDLDCDGDQEGFAGEWLHRLLVDPDELEQPGAEYFIDAWYVVQYDDNIWNTMGHRPIGPEQSGSGWLMNPGPFTQGPTISRWVPESSAANSDHDVITIPSETPEAAYPDNMPQGNLRLAVKVTQVEPGRYRYNYALQNYDFDRGLEGFRINLPVGSEVFETWFGDVDDDAGNDWQVIAGEDHRLFVAPAGNELDWFELFNFEIETDVPPVASEVTLDLGDNASQPAISVTTLGPASGTSLLFEDRFENF